MPPQAGAIAAGHERSAHAGTEMLADGGNAIDAAVAGVFTACTCEPTLTGLGGAGFATVHLAGGNGGTVLDFFAAVPGIDRTVESVTGPVPVEVLFGATSQTFHVGPQSCAVPGFVAGLLEAHERWGRLPRARVLEPGATLAREGLVLTASQAYCHHILEGIVRRRSIGRAIFAPEGPMLGEGEHFSQPALADTIELLAREGADAFYRGDIAREIVRWSDDNGGLLSATDLERYRVREVSAVHARYRGLDYISVPPPSSGGSLIAFALRLLDSARTSSIDLDSAEGAALLVSTMLVANEVRGSEFDRHLYDGELGEWLFSDAMLDLGAERLEAWRNDPHLARERMFPSSQLGSTTHLSVIDGDGNAVSVTTSTGCGSGEFVADTGIHLNNMLGEEDLVPVEYQLVPGQRLTSMMAPSLLLYGGSPVLATGSAGSSRLRSAILQTLLRIVESRHTGESGDELQKRLEHATRVGRLHAEAGVVHAEPSFSRAAIEALENAGHDVNRWPAENLYFGGVNMVAVNNDGTFGAAADPRRGGGAAVATCDGRVTLLPGGW